MKEKLSLMAKKFHLILVLFFLGAGLYAQEMVTDDQTVDPDQNQAWRTGEANYSAKPKNAWELGIHAGHFMIDGDVDRLIPAGYGLGLHLRKALFYSFSLRGDLYYGQARGLETQAWSRPNFGGGLVESVYAPYDNQPDGWFPSHKTTFMYGSLQGVLNIGNILFHKERTNWNWYMTTGIGISHHKAMLDLLNGNTPYANIKTAAGWNPQVLDSRANRKEFKDRLKGVYDGEYETEGPKKAGIFRLGDETNVHILFSASMGVSRKISKRLNLGLEHQVMVTDNDLLDGIRFRSAVDQTNQNDLGHYTNLRLGINLGNFDKITEPLYWLNPLDATMNDIAELKQRPILDLTDSDGDGIIDMLDQEKDSPAGAPVDTRGVTLDSDGDGVPDYLDKEPYSPPGFSTDSEGVSSAPRLSEEDVNRLIDGKQAKWCEECKASFSECGKWFLPMIHFDLDKSRIKPEFYGHLHHVATVLKMCPNICVSVVGHTDTRSSDAYNSRLSYSRAQAAIDHLVTNYGIDRSRLKLMYDGETTPLFGNSRADSEHLVNRRVEFRICEDGDTDMGMPEGMTPRGGGSGSGSTIRGDKNSGF